MAPENFVTLLNINRRTFIDKPKYKAMFKYIQIVRKFRLKGQYFSKTATLFDVICDTLDSSSEAVSSADHFTRLYQLKGSQVNNAVGFWHQYRN